MTSLPFLPLVLPLLIGISILLIQSFGLKLQRLLSLVGAVALVGISINSLLFALANEPQVFILGNWAAPFGIVLVLDQLSALMVLITALLAIGSIWYAITQQIDGKGPHFHTLFHIQLFGLNGAFLTGDVFNLFVFFEVLLLASYGLILHGGGRLRTKAGLHYVVINLIGSTLFLFAVGALYGILGTLNIADMAVKIAELPVDDYAIVSAAGLLLLLVFGLKAAMFPLYLWLPQAYANAPAPIAALFAIMTKVGLYAIIRVHGTLFGSTAGDLAYFYMPWLLALGLFTLLLAALGVLAARGLREQIAYLVLTSVATLLIGIGLNSPAAMSASLYYLIHSTFIAGGFFLLADMIAQGRGIHDDRFEASKPIFRGILLGSFFIFAAIAMTGLPPLSGFFGKFLILAAALEHDWFMIILAIMLISSLFMIIAVAKSGSQIFYQTQVHQKPEGNIFNNSAFIAVIFLLAMSPILVILANPISAFTDSTTAQLLNKNQYIDTVLNTLPIERPSP